MKTDILVNGGITVVLTPENPVEEEALKALTRQKNTIVDLRSTVYILGKTLRNGIVITKADSNGAPQAPVEPQSDTETDEDKA